MPTLRGIDDRPLPLGAWLHERAGVLLRALRVRADPVEVPSPFLPLTLRARSSGKAESVLHVEEDYPFEGYAERRALYTDFLTGFLLPRTTIWSGDELMIRTNALGCRGPELEPGLPVVAFFGDSTTLGVIGTAGGLVGESFVEHVGLPGYEVLNAGVEGLQMHDVVRRYESLRERVPLVCAVVYTGWHNLIYGEGRRPEYWEASLQSFLSPKHLTAICTLPAPLLPEMRTRGIGPLLNESPDASITDDYFIFWGDVDPEEWLGELVDAHERFNAHVIDFCRRTESPLIDLRGFLYPDDYETSTTDFFDVCHLRPRVYPRAAAFIADALQHVLPATPPSVEDWEPPAEREPAPAVEDLRRNIYPIW